MPYRQTPFITDNYYHLFNRGVEKRIVFSDNQDYQRFLFTLYYYQFTGPKPKLSTYKRYHTQNFNENPKIVEVICYCLMPNHFHLLLKQIKDGGIQEFIRKAINSYTKYYNMRHHRVGHLFQGIFKAVPIENDEQLLHVSRYIHLNPYVSGITTNLEIYRYSSYPAFIGQANDSLCVKEPILDFFKSGSEYKAFVNDHASYAQEIEQLKHCLIDSED